MTLLGSFLALFSIIPAPTGPFQVIKTDISHYFNAELAGDLRLDSEGGLNVGHAEARKTGREAESGLEKPKAQLWHPPTTSISQSIPVIFYFSGWSGTTIENPVLIAELVSKGFAVVVIYYEANTGLAKAMNFSTLKAYENTIAEANKRLMSRLRQARFLLDCLQQCEQKKGYKNADIVQYLATEQVGIIGYSFGGAIAAEACIHDNRFKAAVNLDGWIFGQALAAGVPCPYFMWSDSTPIPTDKEAENAYSAQLTQQVFHSSVEHMPRNGGIFARLNKSNHRSFADVNVASWRYRLGWPGRISGGKASMVINTYVSAFFEETLMNKPVELLNNQYPHGVEVDFQRWP